MQEKRAGMDGARQSRTGGQRSSDPTTAQGDSEAAPPSTSGTTPLAIQFTPDELQQLDAEVQHLSQCSVICRVIGSRPSRGELRDLLYGKMQQGAEVIQDVQFLGRGFYHIEFVDASTVQGILGMNPLDLRGAKAFFSPWHSGFNAEEAAKNGEKIFKVCAYFPNLPKEYRSLTNSIGAKLGIPLAVEETMATKISRSAGIPQVRILVSGTSSLPEYIQLPRPGGGNVLQKVEYSGLPNQCFGCRQMGHLAKNCPLLQHKETIQKGAPLYREQRQHVTCFTCKKPGHLARNCTQDRDKEATTIVPNSEEKPGPKRNWQQISRKKPVGGNGVDVPQHIKAQVPLSNKFDVLRDEQMEAAFENQGDELPDQQVRTPAPEARVFQFSANKAPVTERITQIISRAIECNDNSRQLVPFEERSSTNMGKRPLYLSYSEMQAQQNSQVGIMKTVRSEMHERVPKHQEINVITDTCPTPTGPSMKVRKTVGGTNYTLAQ